ncbi:MAG: tetratricopeptide repeat protein, partial [Saprospiraceae bacterium]|nr:tetratricopeptide repeat protein [Saprospiraceae bacterium]
MKPSTPTQMTWCWIAVLLLLVPAQAAVGQPEYHFERLVPGSGSSSSSLGDVATTSKNEVYLLDSKAGSIIKFDAEGKRITTLKGIGTERGNLSLIRPTHLFVDASDNLYVSDPGSNQVLVIREQGSGISIGVPGNKLGQLAEPGQAVADSEGYVTVINKRRNQLDLYGPDGKFVTWLAGFEAPFPPIVDIGINRNDQLYILMESNEVWILDRSRSMVERKIKLAEIPGYGTGVAVDISVQPIGNFFAVNGDNNRVFHLDRSGNILGKIGADGQSAAGVFEEITAVAVPTSRHGHLCILDGKGGVAQVFTTPDDRMPPPTIDPRISITSVASEARPWDVCAVNSAIHYSIPEENFSQVLRHENKQIIPLKHDFGKAVAIAIGIDQSLYVLDQKKKAIEVFDASGEWVRSFGKELSMKRPMSMAVFSNGDVVVCDESGANVHRWSASGVYLKLMAKQYTSPLLSPIHLEVDEDDNLYILDDEKNSIYRFDAQGNADFSYKCRARPEKPGDKPGKIKSFFLDPFNRINLFNSDTRQIETYSWKEEPQLVFSFGSPESGPLQMFDGIRLSFDPYLYRAYLLSEKGKKGQVFQYSITPPAPSPMLAFDVQNDLLQVQVKPVNSKSVVGYAMMAYVNDRPGEIRYTSPGPKFPVDEVGIAERPVLISYAAVSQSYTANSAAVGKFKNYFGYATQLFEKRKYAESLEYFSMALDSMKGGDGMRKYVGARYQDVGRAFVNAERDLDKGLEYLQKSIELDRTTPYNLEGMKIGLVHKYKRLAKTAGSRSVVEDASQLKTNEPDLEPVVVSAIDSLAKQMSREQTENSLGLALEMQRQLIRWNKPPADLSQTMGKTLFQHYLIKRSLGVTDTELELILGEAEIYLRKGVAEVKALRKSHNEVNLMFIEVLNRIGKSQEAEMLALTELTQNIGELSSVQQRRYRAVLGQAYQGQGKNGLAISEYQNILALEPQNVSVRLDLASALVDDKKFNQAKIVYRQLALEKPNDANIIQLLGNVELESQNYAEAVFQYEKALRMNPNDQQIHGPIAQAYFGASNFEKAGEFYEKAIANQRRLLNEALQRLTASNLSRLQSTLGQYLVDYGKIQAQTGAFRESQSVFEEAKDLDANNAEAWYGYGTACLSTGQVYTAVKALHTAIKLDPTNDAYTNAHLNALNLREEMSKNRDPLSISSVAIDDLFPAFHLTYAEVGTLPVGTAVISNHTGLPLFPNSISLRIDGLTSNASVQPKTSLIGYSNNEIKLSAILDPQVMNLTQSKTYNGELTINYRHQDRSYTIREPFTVRVHGRNAITWTDKKKLGAFVSGNVPPLVEYARDLNMMTRGAMDAALPTSMGTALNIYTGLHA